VGHTLNVTNKRIVAILWTMFWLSTLFQWPSSAQTTRGADIAVVVRPDTPAQMTETQFKQFWVAKIFRAEAATPPKIVYSNDLQYELVTAMPGAIAFVDAHNVRPGLKVLRVDGHLPGDRDYPLR
jgi:hypothetical protein